jgi:hypothetical protein
MDMPGLDTEGRAFLAGARKLRYAETKREQAVRPYRERYDRAQDDLGITAAKRVQVAQDFVRASCQHDHVYEENLREVLSSRVGFSGR